MIISVDPELMNEMAVLAMNINAEMDACMGILQSVTVHNDWNCRERDGINEDILAIRQDAGKLKENMDIFSSSVRQVADQFRAFEKDLPRRFQSTDSAFGQTLSSFLNEDIAAEQNTGAASANVADYISRTVITQDMLENNTIANLVKPISPIEFNEIPLPTHINPLLVFGPDSSLKIPNLTDVLKNIEGKFGGNI